MKTLLTEGQLRQRIDRLAAEIRQHYQGRPLTIIGVFVGSIVFLLPYVALLEPAEIVPTPHPSPKGEG